MGGPCPPGWGRGGPTRAAMAHSMTEALTWGKPLHVTSCQPLLRPPDSQGCRTSLPALWTASVRMGRGEGPATCGSVARPQGGLEPRDLLSWGPCRSPEATSGWTELGADLRKQKLSLILPRKCRHCCFLITVQAVGPNGSAPTPNSKLTRKSPEPPSRNLLPPIQHFPSSPRPPEHI